MVPDYIAAVLADSPAAFWELQDPSGNPQDSSGNGKHMDGTSIVTSLSYRNPLGPMSSYVMILTRAALKRSADTVISATNNMTMEIWVATYSNDNTFIPVFWLGVISAATNPSSLGNDGWGLYSSNSGGSARPLIRVVNGGTLTGSTVSTTPWAGSSGNTMEHVVIVRRSGTWELWRNGVQDTSIGTFIDAPGAYNYAGQGAFIGVANASSETFRTAWAALYPVALSASRIQAHYNAMMQWDNAQPILDEQPTAVAAGAFTTKGQGGLMPATPPSYAEYEEFSWVSTGDVEIDYASGGGGSVYVP